MMVWFTNTRTNTLHSVLDFDMGHFRVRARQQVVATPQPGSPTHVGNSLARDGMNLELLTSARKLPFMATRNIDTAATCAKFCSQSRRKKRWFSYHGAELRAELHAQRRPVHTGSPTLQHPQLLFSAALRLRRVIAKNQIDSSPQLINKPIHPGPPVRSRATVGMGLACPSIAQHQVSMTIQ